MDADVVRYPPDLPRRLLDTNPGGITAPLVLIEDSDEASLSPIPVFGSIACGGQRLNCSMRGSME